jgi:hypothetical protein
MHFILRFDPPENPSKSIYIDSFNKGNLLTAEQVCEMLMSLAGIGIFERDIIPSEALPPSKVVLRSLENLLNIYRKEEKWEEVNEILKVMLAIEPSRQLLWRRLQVCIALHEYDAAIEDLEKYEGLMDKSIAVKIRILKNAITRRSNLEFGNIKFRIGEVVLHRPTHGFGVICAYAKTQVPSGSIVYDVLLHGTSNLLCAEQYTLDFVQSPHSIKHPELGRYFLHFDTSLGRYTPNETLLAKYPEL